MINKLDEIYLFDEHTKAYMAFKDFYSFKRTFFLVQIFGITFCVLHMANVSEEKEKLAR